MYKVQLERMREKLITLRSLDPDLELFGAENHEYEMAPVWTQEDITQFEQKWRIELPEDYKVWLLHMGTGGTGPYYGLENPDDGVYAVLGYNDELNAISDPFNSRKHGTGTMTGSMIARKKRNGKRWNMNILIQNGRQACCASVILAVASP